MVSSAVVLYTCTASTSLRFGQLLSRPDSNTGGAEACWYEPY